MYDQLFNEELQNKMTDYLLNNLSKLGTVKAYSKNEMIDPDTADHVYIVLDGAFNQVLYSQDGDEISFSIREGHSFWRDGFFRWL